MTRTLPPWHAALAASETLSELGFRFLPTNNPLPDTEQIRVGDIGGFGAAMSRGIGLIWRTAEPDMLYARFADEHEEALSPEVTEPETSLGGSIPLVEVPIEPTQSTLVDLHRRYVEPGSGLPMPGPFVSARLNYPGERVTCHHEEFNRLRIPLGLIAAEDRKTPRRRSTTWWSGREA